MKASFHNLIQGFRAVVFKKEQLEFRDTSESKSFCHFWLIRVQIPMYRSFFYKVRNNKSGSDIKLPIDTLIEKDEIGRIEEVEVLKPKCVKTKSTFWQFWSTKNPQMSYNFQDLKLEESNSSRKLQIEILKENIKLIVMRRPRSENRKDSILQTKYYLTFLDYKKSIARDGKNSFYHLNFSKKETLRLRLRWKN